MMKCQYCRNITGKTDSRGGCVSCGGPMTNMLFEEQRKWMFAGMKDAIRIFNDHKEIEMKPLKAVR